MEFFNSHSPLRSLMGREHKLGAIHLKRKRPKLFRVAGRFVEQPSPECCSIPTYCNASQLTTFINPRASYDVRRRLRMRIAPAITLSPEQRTVLESQARSRSLPVRVVERARIVLFAASGQQDKEIAAVMAITPKKVSRWRKRFLALGVAGLQKDAHRPGRKPTIGTRLTKRVVTLTTRQQPANATHWSTRTMAAAVGISEASVRRIWRAHGFSASSTRPSRPTGSFT